MTTIKLSLIVNGERCDVDTTSDQTLLYLLRDDIGLTGTKDGCSEGECGACTVLMDGRTVNACLVMAGQAAEREIVTIEGLQNGDDIHPVQAAFMTCGAVQCGFCIPGCIMASVGLLGENPAPTRKDVETELVGNLCRCTGYKKIVDAVMIAGGGACE